MQPPEAKADYGIRCPWRITWVPRTRGTCHSDDVAVRAARLLLGFRYGQLLSFDALVSYCMKTRQRLHKLADPLGDYTCVSP